MVNEVSSAFKTLCILSKAFGGVDHSDFLTKLNYYGIHDLELELKKIEN